MPEEVVAYAVFALAAWTVGEGLVEWARALRRLGPVKGSVLAPLLLPAVLARHLLRHAGAFAVGFAGTHLGMGLSAPAEFPYALTLPSLGVVAAAALGRIGPAAWPAIPALQRAGGAYAEAALRQIAGND